MVSRAIDVHGALCYQVKTTFAWQLTSAAKNFSMTTQACFGVNKIVTSQIMTIPDQSLMQHPLCAWATQMHSCCPSVNSMFCASTNSCSEVCSVTPNGWFQMLPSGFILLTIDQAQTFENTLRLAEKCPDGPTTLHAQKMPKLPYM